MDRYIEIALLCEHEQRKSLNRTKFVSQSCPCINANDLVYGYIDHGALGYMDRHNFKQFQSVA